MHFTKMQAAGNDYVVLDAREKERDWSRIARHMTDRHFGVGADGLLLVTPSGQADIRMRMFNPDGSEAEMCGNGIRCFTKFVIERHILGPTEAGLRIETGAGVLSVYPLAENGRVDRARVEMGRPRLRPAEVPVQVPEGTDIEGPLLDYPLLVERQALALTCVSMGNPHAVAFLDTSVDTFPLHAIGPQVEHHPLFPNRVNFEIVNVLDRRHVRMRTWERGAGETLACGTGACAVGVAARLKNMTDEHMEIGLPGGTLGVRWDGEGPVWLEGPAVEVFEGEWREDPVQ